eukprot:CAMPEP_0119029706 /NCGR_PEP_ID=MMETSP1176-20130426/40656_1 /TAXON_ID=265551 /ORGANISM="Synedropsis recta cf, Strain CCMP1620" /LENGTH=273 /DNA_ID=CAMNT_0006986057 /DNA_START=421 /DNA_END=1245 /DNA_ORIENTATION=-
MLACSSSTATTTSDDKVAQDWDAERYQTQHAFVFQYGSSLVDILDPKPGEAILDLGCGTGELSREIAERVGSAGTVIGIDADPQMIAQAKASSSSSSTEDVASFRVADARSFELDEQVDAIFSNAVLHWIPEADRAVASMSACLKEDTGRLVVELGGKGNVYEIASFLERATSPELNPWYFPSIAEYSTLLEKHGLEILSAQLYDRPTPFSEGEDGLRNWILMFGGAFLEYAQDREQLLQQAESELRPTLHNGDQWVGDYRRIRLVARKTRKK